MITDSSGKGRKVWKSEVIGPAVIVDTGSGSHVGSFRVDGTGSKQTNYMKICFIRKPNNTIRVLIGLCKFWSPWVHHVIWNIAVYGIVLKRVSTVLPWLFIKNVVAVAAYIRLASQSRAKFHNKRNWVTFRLSCAAAPAQSMAFAYLSLQFSPHSCADVNQTRTVPVAFPRHFRSKIQSYLVAAYLVHQSVAGVDVFYTSHLPEIDFIPTCMGSRSLTVNKAKWRNHVTDLRNRS